MPSSPSWTALLTHNFFLNLLWLGVWSKQQEQWLIQRINFSFLTLQRPVWLCCFDRNFADFIMSGLKREPFQASLTCCLDRVQTPRLCDMAWSFTLRKTQRLQQTLMVWVNRPSSVPDDGWNWYSRRSWFAYKDFVKWYMSSFPFISVCEWDGIQGPETLISHPANKACVEVKKIGDGRQH